MKLSFKALILSFALTHLPASAQPPFMWCLYNINVASGTEGNLRERRYDPPSWQDKENPNIVVKTFDFSVVEWTGQECPSNLSGWPAENASSGGDPHFKTWSGLKFDFQGGCDLVLLRNPSFSSGLGMHVHGRTEIHDWWSLIQSVVVQLGPQTIEVEGGANGSYYRINGGPKIPLTTGEIVMGDFSAHITQFNNHSAKVRIDLGHGDAMAIQTFRKFVRFDVSDKSGTAFSGSTGMFGSYPGGEKLARDGVTEIEDANEFGQEWMVRPTDAMLFYGANPSDLPMTCPMPETTMKEGRRRLGEAAISEEDAALACARVKEGDRDACIFDVLATNDKEMAGSY